MTVISVTIIESIQQIIAGIPQTLTFAVNIPATIFYTLDGSTPNTSSSIYVEAITLPTNFPSINLKLFATDGVDSSNVISKIYAPTTSLARMPHDTVIGLSVNGPDQQSIFPFGDFSPDLPLAYGKSGGLVVDDSNVINIPDGYDGAGGISNGTDLPLSSYSFIYSTANAEGETGNGIGTLPAKITIKVPEPGSPSTSSTLGDKFFNPKAMVIYQDSRNASYDNVPQLNRAYFSLQNPERDCNGSLLLNSAFDSSTITGNFLRSQYNPRDNTINYYYRDKATNQWIISKEVFTPRNPNLGALYQVVFSRNSSKVFKWIPFASRKLI